jgi:hypothetical protein
MLIFFTPTSSNLTFDQPDGHKIEDVHPILTELVHGVYWRGYKRMQDLADGTLPMEPFP